MRLFTAQLGGWLASGWWRWLAAAGWRKTLQHGGLSLRALCCVGCRCSSSAASTACGRGNIASSRCSRRMGLYLQHPISILRTHRLRGFRQTVVKHSLCCACVGPMMCWWSSCHSPHPRASPCTLTGHTPPPAGSSSPCCRTDGSPRTGEKAWSSAD